MPATAVTIWKPHGQPTLPDNISDPAQITDCALQLRERERNQIAANFTAENYEVASTYVWTRTMVLLKRQLGTLGAEFIGELLQRPDIDDFSDIATSISDSESISLALDLGIITPLQSKRLFHSHEIVTYFAGMQADLSDDDEVMTKEEAVICLRVCVQGVLGQERIEAAQDFKTFREKLASESLAPDSVEIEKLRASPYFFIRTAISVLLSLFRTTKGAQLEHTARNALLIITEFWPNLKDPERWQIGQAYAEEFNEGKKSSVKGLRSILLKVSGFDYVPENLRSSTFVKVANQVISAHEAHDNFYNEPAPMKELASLGTSIPGPAFAQCMTAALCVKLGNRWGRSTAAQFAADQLLDGISTDRWVHYLDGALEQDRRILYKLGEEKPQKNWVNLISDLDIELNDIESKQVRTLVKESKNKNYAKVRDISRSLYQKSLGIS